MQREYDAIMQELYAIPEIHPQAKELGTTRGFIVRFEQLIKVCESYKEAYEKLEEVHVRVYGRRKYSEWVTFKSIYYRKSKKIQKGR